MALCGCLEAGMAVAYGIPCPMGLMSTDHGLMSTDHIFSVGEGVVGKSLGPVSTPQAVTKASGW